MGTAIYYLLEYKLKSSFSECSKIGNVDILSLYSSTFRYILGKASPKCLKHIFLYCFIVNDSKKNLNYCINPSIDKILYKNVI